MTGREKGVLFEFQCAENAVQNAIRNGDRERVRDALGAMYLMLQDVEALYDLTGVELLEAQIKKLYQHMEEINVN